MISLANATGNVRLFVKIGGGVLAALIVGFVIYQVVTKYIESRKPPPPPEQGFGTLPITAFPAPVQPAGNYSYSIDTLDGKLPALPDRLPVYLTEKPSESFLSLQQARESVGNLGYTQGESRLDRTLYQWTNPNGSIIRYNILSKNFDIASDYMTSSASGVFRSAETGELFGNASSIPTQLGIDSEDLSNAQDSAYGFYKISGAQLLPVEKIEQAQVVRVDLFQKDVEVNPFKFDGEQVTTLPVVYPQAGKSTMNFFLTPGLSGGKVAEVHFVQYPVSSESSDYPLKSADQAWKDLEAGDAYLAKYDPNVKNVAITKVELGYFLGNTDNGYAMPVIRFQGKNFEAYVDAINRNPQPTIAVPQ